MRFQKGSKHGIREGLGVEFPGHEKTFLNGEKSSAAKTGWFEASTDRYW